MYVGEQDENERKMGKFFEKIMSEVSKNDEKHQSIFKMLV